MPQYIDKPVEWLPGDAPRPRDPRPRIKSWNKDAARLRRWMYYGEPYYEWPGPSYTRREPIED